MSRASLRKQQGMTLVEITISIVIMMIVASGVVVFMVDGMRNFGLASAKSDLLGQAQTALDRISSDIVLSASADLNNRIDDANSPVSGNPNGWTSDGDTLILASVVEDSSDNILYADPVQYVSYKNNVIYYLANGSLYRRTLAAAVTGNQARTTCPATSATASCPADSLVLSGVTSFSVKYLDHSNNTVVPDEARAIELSVTMQSKNYKEVTVSYTTRAVFRND